MKDETYNNPPLTTGVYIREKHANGMAQDI
jgi:hypothetical protein